MYFHTAATLHTPEMQANLNEGRLLLRGACFPENATELFQPLHQFLNRHLDLLRQQGLSIHLELSYLNSSARKEIWRLLQHLLREQVKTELILYRGTEEDELDDYEELIQAAPFLNGLALEMREGFYVG